MKIKLPEILVLMHEKGVLQTCKNNLKKLDIYKPVWPPAGADSVPAQLTLPRQEPHPPRSPGKSPTGSLAPLKLMSGKLTLWELQSSQDSLKIIITYIMEAVAVKDIPRDMLIGSTLKEELLSGHTLKPTEAAEKNVLPSADDVKTEKNHQSILNGNVIDLELYRVS